MRTIGIRELKATLSQVLRAVRDGDVFLVTDRGRVVAELRRPDAGERVVSLEDRALARLSAEGHLRLAEPSRRPYRASPLKSPAGLGQRLLDEDRGE
ncbi:MAG TPA: type II toxin-antitoxin system prevent-host-death family antitoxin [Gemmatimonadales bacterium]|nr:type II toxin-antitoxin system prevent-host-death family antitoxin [Gemmatimonadales bacterium]